MLSCLVRQRCKGKHNPGIRKKGSGMSVCEQFSIHIVAWIIADAIVKHNLVVPTLFQPIPKSLFKIFFFGRCFILDFPFPLLLLLSLIHTIRL